MAVVLGFKKQCGCPKQPCPRSINKIYCDSGQFLKNNALAKILAVNEIGFHRSGKLELNAI